MKRSLRDFVLIASTILPSRLRVAIYRLCGCSIGSGVRLSPLSIVVAPKIDIGNGSKVWPLTVLTSGTAIEIGAHCQITPFVFIYGDREFVMAEKAYIGTRAVINTTERVEIGRNSGVGPNCMLYTHGVFLPYSQGYPRRLGRITLEENVWLMLGVSVLPGVRIGANSIIAGGLVVSKDIAPGSYAQGQSAKLRVASIDLLKHDRVNDPNRFTEELLTELARVGPSFEYARLAHDLYELRLGKDRARLRIVGGNDSSSKSGETADFLGATPPPDSVPFLGDTEVLPAIVFRFDGADPSSTLSTGTCFDIEALTVTRTADPVSKYLAEQLNRYFGMNFSRPE